MTVSMACNGAGILNTNLLEARDYHCPGKVMLAVFQVVVTNVHALQQSSHELNHNKLINQE